MARRLTGRQKDRGENIGRTWAAKFAKASTPAEVAATKFDQVRAAIGKLPDREAQACWREVGAALDSTLQRITHGDVHGERSRRGSR